ncbi:hypothetical protein [Sutcliffiella deserti]|uniref:hypothetical protein n=1 Tax=Sutcliffiella deserti TaxID=2875501 RepID=UPI001CBD95C3|nr:hypothetical protein [Sutcliffiella deserti]
MTNQQELIFTQQQVIHYRAEVSKYKNRIAELELHIEKEKMRNKYLQSKIRELQIEKTDHYIKEMEKLRKKILQLEVELEEEKLLGKDMQELPQEPLLSRNEKMERLTHFYSFFNYSILLHSEEDTTVTIFFDFTVVNTGEREQSDFIICLKVKPVNKIFLSGKITNPKLIQHTDEDRHAADWVYATEDWQAKIRNEGEYWIRSVQKPKVGVQETLTFKGVEILVDKETVKGKMTVEGFVYCENEVKESNNKITVNL